MAEIFVNSAWTDQAAFDADTTKAAGAVWGTTAFNNLTDAVKAASATEENIITVSSGTYSDSINFRASVLGEQKEAIKFVAAAGADVTFTGTMTLGYFENRVGAENWSKAIGFSGITFDHTDAATHSILVYSINGFSLDNCKVIGDGEYGIGSTGNNNSSNCSITNSTFENAGIQVSGNFGTGLKVSGNTFNNSCVNVQGGNSVNFSNNTFNSTITDANVGESFYCIRSNDTAISIEDCEFNIDSTVTGTAEEQAKWGILWQRNVGATKWSVNDIEINLTDAAMAQGELLINKNGTTNAANEANRITISGLTSTGNNVDDLLARSEGALQAVVGNNFNSYDDGNLVSSVSMAVLYVNSSYNAATPVENRIFGVNAFADFESALAAASRDKNVTRIEIESDITSNAAGDTENYYTIAQKLTIGAAEGGKFNVNAAIPDGKIAPLVQGNGASLTIEDGVTIENLDVVANGFWTQNEEMVINGEIKAVSLKVWTSNNGITVGKTGKVTLGSGDGQLDWNYGNGYLNVTGNLADTKDESLSAGPQVKAGYSTVQGYSDGGRLTLTDTYYEGGSWFNISGKNFTADLDNSMLKVSGGDTPGSLSIGGSGNIFNVDNGSRLVAANVTLNEGNTIEIDSSSLEVSGKLTNNGTVTVSGNSSINVADLASGITILDGTTLTDSVVGGKVVMLGNLTLAGDNRFTTISATDGGTLTLEEGKTLTLTNFSFGNSSNASAEYTITGGKITASYGFFQHGKYTLESEFETGYMYYSYGSDITVKGTFHSQGAGDGLDYVRGALTVAEGGKSIHDKALWVGQPESWGAMTASLTVEAGGLVDASTLNVYTGSSLSVSGNVTADTIENTGAITVTATGKITASSLTGDGTVTIDAAGAKGVLKVIDLSGKTSIEDKVVVENLAEGVKVIYGKDGDVVLTDVKTDTIYVDTAFSGNVGTDLGNGKYLDINAFNTLGDALDVASATSEIRVASNITEELSKKTLSGSIVKDGETDVTVTDSKNDDYVNLTNLSLGEGVTLDVKYTFIQGTNTINGTVKAGSQFWHGYGAKTTINGTVDTYNTFNRYGSDIYIVGTAEAGKGKDADIQYKSIGYLGTYSGVVSVKDTAAAFGYFNFGTSVDDGYSSAKIVLDNALLKSIGGPNGQPGQMDVKNGAVLEAKNDSVLDLTGVNKSGYLVMESGTEFTFTDSAMILGKEGQGSNNLNGSITLTNSTITTSGTLNNGGSITIDENSLITAKQITGDGTITIDATGLKGTNKVINLDAAASLEGKVTVIGEGVTALYGTDGDVTVTDASTKTVYYNSAWSDKKDGDDLGDGKVYGHNAFNEFTDNGTNAAGWGNLLVLPEDTTEIVLTAGNADTSYGMLRPTQEITVKTEGEGYAVIDRIVNMGVDLTVDENAKLKVLTTQGLSGANNQGGALIVNGELYFANATSSNKAIYLWGMNSTPGQLVINAGGLVKADAGNIENHGTVTVYGTMELGKAGDAPKLAGVGASNGGWNGHLVVDGKDGEGLVTVLHNQINFGGGNTSAPWEDAPEGCSVDIVNGGKITTAAVSFRNGKNNVLNITDGTFEFIDDADYAAITPRYFDNQGVITVGKDGVVNMANRTFTNDGVIKLSDNASISAAEFINNNTVEFDNFTGAVDIDGDVRKGTVNFKGDNTYSGALNAASVNVGDWTGQNYAGSVDFGTASDVNVGSQMIIGYDSTVAGANTVTFGDADGEATDKVFKSADVSVRRDGVLTIANTTGNNQINTMNVMGKVIIDNAKLATEVQIGYKNADMGIEAEMVVQNGAEVTVGWANNSPCVVGKSSGGKLTVDNASVIINHTGSGASYRFESNDAFIVGYNGAAGVVDIKNNGNLYAKYDMIVSAESSITVTDAALQVDGKLTNRGSITVSGNSTVKADVAGNITVTDGTVFTADTNLTVYGMITSEGSITAVWNTVSGSVTADTLILTGVELPADGVITVYSGNTANVSNMVINGSNVAKNSIMVDGIVYNITTTDAAVTLEKGVAYEPISVVIDNLTQTEGTYSFVFDLTIGGGNGEYTTVVTAKDAVTGNAIAGTYDDASATFTFDSVAVTTPVNFTVVVTDSYGQHTEITTGDVIHVADVTAPEFSSVDGTVDGDKLTLAWSASDNFSVVGYTVSINGTEYSLIGADETSFEFTASASGVYSYTVTAFDAAGNKAVSNAADAELYVAMQPGVVTLTQVEGEYAFIVDASVTGGKGAYAYTYVVTDAAGNAVDFTLDGSKISFADTVKSINVAVTVTDEAGKSIEMSGSSAVADYTAPELAVTGNITGWTNGSVTLNAASSDNFGDVTVQYQVGGGEWMTGNEVVLNANANVIFKAFDAAGNIVYNTVSVTGIDQIAPALQVVGNPQAWTAGNVVLSVIASDALSGVASVEYSFDNAAWTAVANNTLTLEENAKVYFKVTDIAGNVTTDSIDVTNIDKAAPELTVTTDKAHAGTVVTINAEVAESGSGLASFQYSFDGIEWQDCTGTVKVSSAATVYFKAIDKVGNISTSEITVSSDSFSDIRSNILDNGYSQIVAWDAARGAVGYVANTGVPGGEWKGVWEWTGDEAAMWRVAAVGNFGDTLNDKDGILLYNASNNTFAAWTDLGSGDYGYKSLAYVENNFNTKCIANLDGDGIDDVLIFNDHGNFGAVLNATEYKDIWHVPVNQEQTVELVGAGYFGADDKRDSLLVKNLATNTYELWHNNGDIRTTWAWSGSVVSAIDSDWMVAGIGDFQGDGIDDIVMWQKSTGYMYAWENGKSDETRWVGALDNSDWEVAAVGDYNGDGKEDLLLRELVSGWGGLGIWGGAYAGNWTDLNSRVESDNNGSKFGVIA